MKNIQVRRINLFIGQGPVLMQRHLTIPIEVDDQLNAVVGIQRWNYVFPDDQAL